MLDFGDLSVAPIIPVSDLERSLTFYVGALGLTGEAVPGGYALFCGGGTILFLLPGTGFAGRAVWPVATFETTRLDEILELLADLGVKLDSIPSGPQQTDERGIAHLGTTRIVWMRDPDNHVISVFEPVEPTLRP